MYLEPHEMEKKNSRNKGGFTICMQKHSFSKPECLLSFHSDSNTVQGVKYGGVVAYRREGD